eukprot:scaffold6922_cov363-Prasinococcus_capsulatus_cf.AAC.1
MAVAPPLVVVVVVVVGGSGARLARSRAEHLRRPVAILRWWATAEGGRVGLEGGGLARGAESGEGRWWWRSCKRRLPPTRRRASTSGDQAEVMATQGKHAGRVGVLHQNPPRPLRPSGSAVAARARRPRRARARARVRRP